MSANRNSTSTEFDDQLRIGGMRRDELSLICHGLESEIIQQLMQGSTSDEFKVVIWLLGDNSDTLEALATH